MYTPIANEESPWNGYVLAGDNLDRNIRPRHQTIKSQTRSEHWLNSIAIKDRCDFSAFADAMAVPDIASCDVLTLLPDDEDCKQLMENISIIISIIIGRFLVKYVPGFSEFSPLVQHHIDHPYSSSMSRKSRVVSTCKCNVVIEL